MKHFYQDRSKKAFRKKLRNEATYAEQLMWHCLRKRSLEGYKFTRQYGVGPYILDFYCPEKRLAVEIDGGQHDENRAYDEKRTEFLNQANIRVLRYWNNEVQENLDGVCEDILRHLDGLSPL